MKSTTILIVDRTRARAAKLAAALEPLGPLDWKWTANPSDADVRSADAAPDAIIADWEVLGGVEGVRRIGFRPGTPLIVLTGRIAQEEVVASLKAGAADCVRRTNLTRVLAAVREELEQTPNGEAGTGDAPRFRQLVQDLRRAAKSRADFVGNLSHELRTPLNVIIGYSDMLLDQAFGELGDDPSNVIGKISRQARELLDLVNTTLELSRIEAGRIPLEVEPVDIGALISEIEEETSMLIHSKDVRLTRDLPNAISKPCTDAIKLRVIVKNLVTNAMKFTEQGSVEISARDVDDGIELAVRDTGPGIPPEQQKSIFDAFEQGDTARGQRGAGLGLHIVQRLLAVLGGTIALESNVGEGSEFRIWIPLQRGQTTRRTA